ncbi:AraC family transcriptional regulator [Streptomyces sp. LX-29]|uniref:helix-turn-helix domain-containing protein n=1 Tax=Streptomyces sp. LX-29 TaxID=2900152 RepID=UPI00240DC6F7|nr:AraC family transcriptional regulator [Streptomyces sp. LX-29]WFB06031.1 AraC family transcriptional regulator [Streptomyces sp. LX-29]
MVHTGRSANLRWSADGTACRERFHAGEALVNPAGWASRPRWQDDVELLLLAMEPAWLEKLAAEEGAEGGFELAPRFHFTDPLLTMLVERLVTEFERPGAPDALYTESLVQAAAALVMRACGSTAGPPEREGGLPPRRLAEVLDFIHANLASRIRLADLAGVAGVSASHFTRAFKASVGESPHRYVTQLRLERARRALLTTNRPIADIALEHGFADQSHLTRMMRRHTGTTPGLLRDGHGQR